MEEVSLWGKTIVLHVLMTEEIKQVGFCIFLRITQYETEKEIILFLRLCFSYMESGFILHGKMIYTASFQNVKKNQQQH